MDEPKRGRPKGAVDTQPRKPYTYHPKIVAERAKRVAAIIAMAKGGKPATVIAAKLGLSPNTVRAIARKGGHIWECTNEEPYPGRNVAVLERAKSGASCVTLAKEFEISRQRVSKILHAQGYYLSDRKKNKKFS
jgi:DNA invertase Pin-like site-specific DNA recombinase